MSCEYSRAVQHRIATLVLLSGALALPSIAAAQPQQADPVAATLFRRGRDLIKEGHWEAGCAKFRASLARWSSASTLLNLARCHEHYGRVASAWAEYQRALTVNRETTGPKRKRQLEEIARQGIAKLLPRLPRIRIEIVNPPAGVTIMEGGRPLPIGEAVPLDPGVHVLVVSAPGHADSRRQVTLREGQVEVATFALTALTATEQPAISSTTGHAARPMPSAVSPPLTSRDIVRPWWPWMTGALGLASVGVGIGFGVDAAMAQSDLKRICGSDLVCDEDLSFDPDPLNGRRNRGAALAIGLGSAGAIALGVAIVGLIVSGDASPNAGTSTNESFGVWHF